MSYILFVLFEHNSTSILLSVGISSIKYVNGGLYVKFYLSIWSHIQTVNFNEQREKHKLLKMHHLYLRRKIDEITPGNIIINFKSTNKLKTTQLTSTIGDGDRNCQIIHNCIPPEEKLAQPLILTELWHHSTGPISETKRVDKN